jgi:hypothetical protein
MKLVLFCDSQNCNCPKQLENTHENLHACKNCEFYSASNELLATKESWYAHEKDELEHNAW